MASRTASMQGASQSRPLSRGARWRLAMRKPPAATPSHAPAATCTSTCCQMCCAARPTAPCSSAPSQVRTRDALLQNELHTCAVSFRSHAVVRWFQHASDASVPSCAFFQSSPGTLFYIWCADVSPPFSSGALVGCADNALLCGTDEGSLLCAGLDHCNGHGDCHQGRCYCHVGYAGAAPRCHAISA